MEKQKEELKELLRKEKDESKIREEALEKERRTVLALKNSATGQEKKIASLQTKVNQSASDTRRLALMELKIDELETQAKSKETKIASLTSKLESKDMEIKKLEQEALDLRNTMYLLRDAPDSLGRDLKQRNREMARKQIRINSPKNVIELEEDRVLSLNSQVNIKIREMETVQRRLMDVERKLEIRRKDLLENSKNG